MDFAFFRMHCSFQHCAGLLCDPRLQVRCDLDGYSSCPRNPSFTFLLPTRCVALACFRKANSSKPTDVFLPLEGIDLSPGRKKKNTTHSSDCGIPRAHGFWRSREGRLLPPAIDLLRLLKSPCELESKTFKEAGRVINNVITKKYLVPFFFLTLQLPLLLVMPFYLSRGVCSH